MSHALTFRDDYAQTAEGLSALGHLIRTIFNVDVSPLDRLGHDPTNIAFGWWQGGTLVANVSLYERSLTLMGKSTPALCVQSVATLPAFRGRGLFRNLLTRALAHAEARVALVILVTDIPPLYAPFGFRPVRESSFHGPLPVGSAPPNHRTLSLTDDTDVALLRKAFSRRTPVSLRAAACDHPSLFLLKAHETPSIELTHLPDLDAVIAVDRSDPTQLVLLDIIAPAIPSLSQIAAALGADQRDAELRFTPDRLGWTWADQRPLETGLMVRGPYLPEDQPSLLTTMHV